MPNRSKNETHLGQPLDGIVSGQINRGRLLRVLEAVARTTWVEPCVFCLGSSLETFLLGDSLRVFFLANIRLEKKKNETVLAQCSTSKKQGYLRK